MINSNLKLYKNNDLSFKRPLVMSILNATPDSFSDGGEITDKANLENKIRSKIDDGADILDVGGESTRPGYTKIDADEENRRILPVINTIRKISNTIPISIDTSKADVAKSALDAGANFINDVSCLSDKLMAEVVIEYNCSIVLMRGNSLNDNVVESCRAEFNKIIVNAKKMGINKNQIILDPGLGFGKFITNDFKSLPGASIAANFELVMSINEYSLGMPVLIGASRKRFIGEMMNEPNVKKRDSGSAAVALIAAINGTNILRVHDVAATKITLSKVFN